LRILITNDDGLYSPGLWAVASTLKELGEVVVVAPDRDQSGIGAAMTLQSVVRAREIAPPPVEGIRTYAVEGTPADCVILAAETLITEPIDLVVSGINQGSNLGLDIMTSGTVGGAFQGYFHKIPAIAISIASLTDLQYEAASQAAKSLAAAISKNNLPSPMLLNVNLPNAAPDRIEKVEITKLGPRLYLENVERGTNGRITHYWIKHNKPANPSVTEGTDIWAVRNNRISITSINGLFSPDELSSDLQALADEVAAGLGLTLGS
jgi:5'-nucleotidase